MEERQVRSVVVQSLADLNAATLQFNSKFGYASGQIQVSENTYRICYLTREFHKGVRY